MNFTALSGLPRSGSTLLSSILSQNPEIHAEGNSAVCQLMWDMQVSCTVNAHEQLSANNRMSTQDSLVAAIPAIYYRDVRSMHIVDKCRSWTLPPNMEMLRRYISDPARVIVLTRPIDDIVRSFVRVRKANGWTCDLERGLLDEGTEPIMRSLMGVNMARQADTGEFLFIEYDDLVDSTQEIIESIYGFCEWEPFHHTYSNIVNPHPENDLVYGLIGLHDVRDTISRTDYSAEDQGPGASSGS